VVGGRFNPCHPPTEHPLFLPCTRSGTARARCAAPFALTLLVALVGCRDALTGFASGPGALANVEQLFGALGARHADVARNVKYEYARLQIAKGALVPSRVFVDSGVWTRRSADVRLLETQGSFVDGKYALVSRIDVPAPRKPADGRHAITLSRLSDSEFRWDTAVDFAIGSIRPTSVASVLARLVASAEGKTEREARADLAASAPRTSGALGQLFSLDSLRPTRLGDGSTAVTLVVGLHSDRLRRRFPAFGDYVRRYVDPVRYRVVVTDQGGTPFFEAVGADRQVTIRLRTCNGEMVPLSGPVRVLPDTLAMLVDFKARIKHLGVGFHGLRMELVHVRHGASENSWAVTARREPEWDFPLATARLIRAPLRRPFAGEGSLFRIGVRGDGTGPTVIVRQIRLFVQESAILRFLNSLSGAAFSEFEDRVDQEENAWLREVFAGMRADVRGAIGG
jgi:hypothetical protein